jgi:hypothetical protein
MSPGDWQCPTCGRTNPIYVQRCAWCARIEGAEADRPQDLPVPANADRRYDEMDGG